MSSNHIKSYQIYRGLTFDLWPICQRSGSTLRPSSWIQLFPVLKLCTHLRKYGPYKSQGLLRSEIEEFQQHCRHIVSGVPRGIGAGGGASSGTEGCVGGCSFSLGLSAELTGLTRPDSIVCFAPHRVMLTQLLAEKRKTPYMLTLLTYHLDVPCQVKTPAMTTTIRWPLRALGRKASHNSLVFLWKTFAQPPVVLL